MALPEMDRGRTDGPGSGGPATLRNPADALILPHDLDGPEETGSTTPVAIQHEAFVAQDLMVESRPYPVPITNLPPVVIERYVTFQIFTPLSPGWSSLAR